MIVLAASRCASSKRYHFSKSILVLVELQGRDAQSWLEGCLPLDSEMCWLFHADTLR